MTMKPSVLVLGVGVTHDSGLVEMLAGLVLAPDWWIDCRESYGLEVAGSGFGDITERSAFESTSADFSIPGGGPCCWC